MSKVDEIKKVAAMVTTAEGDLSAVEGVSISEVIEFMADNLNVAEDGTLVVSELLKPVVNLLSEPIPLEIQADGKVSQHIDNINLELGKTYNVLVNGKYSGNDNVFEAVAEVMESSSTYPPYNVEIEEGLLLLPAYTGAIAVHIYPNAKLEEGQLVYSENTAYVYVTDTEEAYDLVLTSITEA